MRKRLASWFAVVMIFCLATVLLVRPLRLIVLGVLKNEHFYGGRPTTYWINRLEDGDDSARLRATFALGRGDLDRSGEPPPFTEQEAKEVVPVLIRALSDANSDVRSSVAFALGDIGPEGNRAIPALIQSLGDSSATVRAQVASTLASMDRQEVRIALPALKETLKDKDPSVRLEAALSLWAIDHQLEPAVATLVEVLQDKNNVPGVRRDAAWHLELIGPEAKAAIPALVEATKDEAENVRKSAKKAIQRIDPQRAMKGD